MLFIEDRDRKQWDRIERGILAILKADNFIIHMELKMSKELDDLTAEVAQDIDVESSAVTAIARIEALLADAGTDPAKLASLQTSLASARANLAAAIANTTPPAPAP